VLLAAHGQAFARTETVSGTHHDEPRPVTVSGLSDVVAMAQARIIRSVSRTRRCIVGGISAVSWRWNADRRHARLCIESDVDRQDRLQLREPHGLNRTARYAFGERRQTARDNSVTDRTTAVG
jgi:hypothetical protein